MDKNIGVENRVKRATFAIVDSHCETSCIAHSFQQQPIYSSITERRHMLRPIFQDEPLLLLVVTSVVVQKVQLDGQSREFAACGTEGVHGENVDLDQPGKLCEAGSDTPPHNSFEGVRAGIVGHDPTYFQRSKTRDRELNHLALRREGVTAHPDIPDLMGPAPLFNGVDGLTLGMSRALQRVGSMPWLGVTAARSLRNGHAPSESA